jgi:hypothetical protein
MSEEYLFEGTIDSTNNIGEIQEYNLKINKIGNIFLKMRTGGSCPGHGITWASPYKIIFENIDNIPITLDDKTLIEETFNMQRQLPNSKCLINIIKCIKNTNKLKEDYLQKNNIFIQENNKLIQINTVLQEENNKLIQINTILQEENDKLNKLNSSIIQYFT